MQRESFKRSVKKLHKVVTAFKPGAKLGHVYEAVSRAAGFNSWDHLSASLEILSDENAELAFGRALDQFLSGDDVDE